MHTPQLAFANSRVFSTSEVPKSMNILPFVALGRKYISATLKKTSEERKLVIITSVSFTTWVESFASITPIAAASAHLW